MTIPPRTGLRRLWYVASWRVRYWWLDTRAGLVAQLLVSLAFVVVGCWSVWMSIRRAIDATPAAGDPVHAAFDWWVYAIMFVVSIIVSLALAPKIKGAPPQKVQVPVVEDGAVIRRIYGPVWIKDPIMLAFKPTGTVAIRKKAGKSWKLKTKWQTVGYHYEYIFQFGLCRGMLDSVLAIRAGDKEVWSGQLTSSGIVSVNKPNLWGGEDAEGGIVGDFEFAFGNPDQAPSSYLASNVAPQQSAYRWRPYATFRGGRWGNSPYPKPPAFLVSRILNGWDGGECWYPERAQVPVYSMTSTRPTSIYITMDRSGSMAGSRMTILKAAMQTVIDRLEVWKEETRQDLDVMLVSFADDSQSITRRGINGGGFGDLRAFVDGMVASGGTSATAAYGGALGFFSPTPPRNNVVVAVSDGDMDDVAAAVSAMADLLDRDAAPYCTADNNAVAMYGVGITTAGSLASFSNMGPPTVIDGSSADELAELILSALLKVTGFGGMNVAHVLYDSLIAREMDGESRALINEPSWRAAADRLYNESFGIGTEFIAGQETIEQFQQRLCDLAGARMSVDPTTGEWHLDLIRSDVPGDLLVITDDDVLEFEEQPSVLDEAVNQVTARWTDMLNDEVRATAPVQALGAIQAFGAVNAEVLECPEVLAESLALRLAARNLDARATPLKRHTLKVTRMAYRARPGQKARLQLPKRGIADMVVVLGDISRGTLRSGAIALTTVQDVASMPASTYIVEEPGVAPPAAEVAGPAPAQLAMELPYRELVQLLSDADLQALPVGAGYAGLLAAAPVGAMDFLLYTRSESDDFEEAAVGAWCPHATIMEASLPTDPDGGLLRQAFTLVNASGVSAVVPGTAALWGDEVVRVDAIDVAAGTVLLARGCLDTVPQPHAAGQRIWFYDADLAVDPAERPSGASVEMRALTRAASDQLPLASAPTSTVAIVGRAALPYPMGRLRINGDFMPEAATGAMTVTWVSRDRVAQADALVDHEAGGITPSADTRWGLRVRAGNTTLVERADIAGGTATIDLDFNGDIVIEAWAINDAGPSWQRHVWPLAYTADAATGNTIAAPTWTPVQTIIDGGEVAP